MTEENKKKLLERLGNEFILLNKDIDELKIKEDITLKHLKCGTEYRAKLYIFLRDSSKRNGCCPTCRHRNRQNKSTDGGFIKKIKERFGDEWEILSEYKDKNTKILVKHNPCNSKPYEIYPSSLLRKKPNQPCKFCSNRMGLEEFKKRVLNNKLHDGQDYEVLSTEYNGKRAKIEMRHIPCGNRYFVIPNDFLGSKAKKGTRCPYCAGKKYTSQDYIDKIHLLDNTYQFIGGVPEQMNVNDPIELLHKPCKTKFSTTYANFVYNGSRCPHCYIHGKSKNEEDVWNFIKELYPTAERNKRFYFDKKQYREADIFIKDKNIIIEYDGLYWHAEGVAETRLNLLEKTNFFKKLGYRTIHIFEDEWLYKNDIVKSKLKSILNISDDIRIYARKCKLVDISKKTKTDFLEKYHIQGDDISKYYAGLEFNGKLVAVMTFSKPRLSLGQKNTEKKYELSRYATSNNVIGGFSKLLKYLREKYSLENIFTYADIRWSDQNSNLYSKNGFELSHISGPGYYYLSKDKYHREHRFNYRKGILKNKFPEFYKDELTEREITSLAGLYRIWDCGNLVYTLKK